MRSAFQRESGGANEVTRARMARLVPPRKLAWGYYKWAEHLLHLEMQRKAGIVFRACDLAASEIAGIVALDQARAAFGGRHPACSGCGTRLANKFAPECPGCGAKFARKKS
jgi:hypothetical protein